MKVMTQYRNIKPSQHLDDVIEEIIQDLEKSIRVESAEVTVERAANGHPPVRVSLFIETPGPDIMVQARDYTPPAALLKARRALDKRVDLKVNDGRTRTARAPRPARPVRRSVGPSPPGINHQPRWIQHAPETWRNRSPDPSPTL